MSSTYGAGVGGCVQLEAAVNSAELRYRQLLFVHHITHGIMNSGGYSLRRGQCKARIIFGAQNSAEVHGLPRPVQRAVGVQVGQAPGWLVILHYAKLPRLDAV